MVINYCTHCIFFCLSPEKVEIFKRHGMAFGIPWAGCICIFILKALYIQLVTAALERIYHSIA